MRTRWWVGVLAGGLLPALAGCDRGDGPQAVGGVVTFRGQPVEQGTVTFLTDGPKPTPGGGALIRGGRYDIPAAQGLLPGVYKVRVSVPGPPAKQTKAELAAKASPRASELAPAKYNAATMLSAEVTPGGANQFDFVLN